VDDRADTAPGDGRGVGDEIERGGLERLEAEVDPKGAGYDSKMWPDPHASQETEKDKDGECSNKCRELPMPRGIVNLYPSQRKVCTRDACELPAYGLFVEHISSHMKKVITEQGVGL
jgi:hypothetical protein